MIQFNKRIPRISYNFRLQIIEIFSCEISCREIHNNNSENIED